MTEHQSATTRFCARIIGPLMLIIGAVVAARFDTIATMIPGILEDGPLTFVIGIFTLTVGMILFAAHHHWTSPTAILVSLLGVFTVARGVILLLAPGFATEFATQALEGGPAAWIAAGAAIAIGLWLSWAGWFARSAG
ncbi:MAG: hypothetical protein ACREH4_07930 [Vitreimonas sp.]